MSYSTSATEPQFITLNSLQDAFQLLNRGFDAYSQVVKSAANDTNSNTRHAHAAASEDTTPEVSPVVIPVATTTVQKRRSYQPDVDVYESPDAVTIEISLPGVDKSGINIEYDTKLNRLLFSGDSKRAHPEGVKLIRSERPVGSFERVVGLGTQSILADQIGAEFKDGVLIVNVPKNKEAEIKRRISIL